MGLLELLQPYRETFLKASRSESSAPWALEGLGTWGLIPTFLRYSKPRLTCTFSKPRSSVLSSTPPSARSTSPRPAVARRAPLEAPLVRPRRAEPSPSHRGWRGDGRPVPPLPARCSDGLCGAPSQGCSR